MDDWTDIDAAYLEIFGEHPDVGEPGRLLLVRPFGSDDASVAARAPVRDPMDCHPGNGRKWDFS